MYKSDGEDPSQYVINLPIGKRLTYGVDTMERDTERKRTGYYISVVDSDGKKLLYRGYTPPDVLQSAEMLALLETWIPDDLNSEATKILQGHKGLIAQGLPF